jgi:NAD-dependent dihydropyrimidine dehydrogenase PreA subunit
MRVNEDKCKGCGFCEEVCPLEVIKVIEKKAHIEEGCVECKACLRVCPHEALIPEAREDYPKCEACPIMCKIPEGAYGACKRYLNEGGRIIRKGRIYTYEEIAKIMKYEEDPVIEKPIITGIGIGTTYPDFRPSPLIVSSLKDGIEIITAVTEAPLSYSALNLKIDTDFYIGSEGKRVFVRRKGKRTIGHVCTEQYGSKIISIGGVNILTSKDGLFVAKVMLELIQGKKVIIEVEDGPQLEIRIGEAPVINGVQEKLMRVGCGSATIGLFAPYMLRIADEIIVLDGHITGLFSEHPAAKYLGKERSGIYIKGDKSTEGRYFLPKGKGWGGTNIEDPLEVISWVDTDKFKEGMTLLITETTGRKFAFYKLKNGKLEEEQPPPSVIQFLELLRQNCEESRVSAVFIGGIGGSARGGVTKNPIKLTNAVHEGKVTITIGGVKPFIFPGGGINFIVDVTKIKKDSIYMSPTPSFIVPIEYTMRKETFEEIGGHIEVIKKIEEVLKPNDD